MENKDLKYLKERVYEELKRGMYSEFLEPHEVKTIIPFLNKMKIKYQIFHIFPDCEKVILFNDQKPHLTCYQILSKKVFRHQDVLGSIFSYQVNKNVFGDIVKIEDSYYIIILTSLRKYFESFFTMIGKHKIALKEVPLDTVSHYSYQFTEIKIIVPSMRVDLVLAKLLNTSRKVIFDKLSDGEVYKNYEVVKQKSCKFKEGDIFSVRKFGKYQIDKVEGITKKGNQIVIIKKYC